MRRGCDRSRRVSPRRAGVARSPCSQIFSAWSGSSATATGRSSKARRRCPTTCAGEVTANLTRMYGTGLDTSFEENPALIAGMRIRVGSDVYDGSVRARLASIDAAWSE